MSLNYILADAATTPATTTIGPGAAPATTTVAAPGATVQVDPSKAQQPQAAPGGILGNPMLLMIIVFGVMIFFMFRSQKKQQQKRQAMLSKIVKGTRVMLNNGMFGTIAEVRETSYIVEIADKVQVEVIKNGVAEAIDTSAPAEKK